MKGRRVNVVLVQIPMFIDTGSQWPWGQCANKSQEVLLCVEGQTFLPQEPRLRALEAGSGPPLRSSQVICTSLLFPWVVRGDFTSWLICEKNVGDKDWRCQKGCKSCLPNCIRQGLSGEVCQVEGPPGDFLPHLTYWPTVASRSLPFLCPPCFSFINTTRQILYLC